MERLIKNGNSVNIQEREITQLEFERMKLGFDENSIDNEVEIQSADRFGFVAEKDNKFIGCSSGLAYKNGDNYSGWFYLTNLFVEKDYRFQKVGKELLLSLEEKIKEKKKVLPKYGLGQQGMKHQIFILNRVMRYLQRWRIGILMEVVVWD